MSDEAALELLDLVRHARVWVEWMRDSGVDELPSETDRRRELASLARGGIAPAHDRRPAQGMGPARDMGPGQDSHSVQPAPAGSSPASAVVRSAPPAASSPPAAALAPAERERRLAILAEEVKACTRCRLHEGRTQTVFSRGTPHSELLFVGEGPGFHEDHQGLPFVGKAGQLLDKMIGAMGFSRDEVYICNAVKCRPPDNRKPEPDEIAACAPYLQQQLELIAPKVIVALGATGIKALVGSTAGITHMRGKWKLYRGRIPIMPTFHPAYLLRQPEKKREVWSDLQAVLVRLGRRPPKKRSKPRS